MNLDAAAQHFLPHAQDLVNLVEGAWAAYIDENIPRSNPTTRAGIVNDYMHDFVEVHLPTAERCAAARKDKPMYRLDDVTVRFKYLRHGRPTNIPTGVQAAIGGQQPLHNQPVQIELEFGDGPTTGVAEPPYVTIGYTLDAAEADIEQLLAVYMIDDRVIWSLDLRGLAATTAVDVPMVTPIAPTPVMPELPAVTPRPAAMAEELPVIEIVGDQPPVAAEAEESDRITGAG